MTADREGLDKPAGPKHLFLVIMWPEIKETVVKIKAAG